MPLIIGLVCTLAGGLSVHVILQQTLNVPFPSNYPVHSVLEQIDQAGIVVGLLLLLSWAEPSLRAFGFVRRWLVVACVYTMLRESFRAALMEGVVTTAYAYPLLTLVPKLVGYLALTLFCVIAQPHVPRLWQKILAAFGIYAIFAILVQPLISTLFASPLVHVAYLRHDEIYSMPYGPPVLIPAYITYIEPAAGCIWCASLVWQHLAGGRAVYLSFVLLVLLIRRSLFPPFIYAAAEPHHRLTAFASAGQFSLESIALALLAALTWRYAGAVVSGVHRSERTNV